MSYISSLNILTDDTPVPLSEEALNEELALWANAQFTFDSEPGSAVPEDPYKSIAEQADLFATFTSFNNLNANSSPHTINQVSNTNAVTSIGHSNNNNTILYQESSIQQCPQVPSPTTTMQQQQQQQHLLPKQANTLPRLAPAPAPQKPVSTVPLSQSLSPLVTDSLSNKYTSASFPSPTTPTSAQAQTSNNNKKRKSIIKDNLKEVDKEAIEEDKRRRNTAASARFRMKKKLREQALEKTAKEMTLKAETLEKRVLELEKEVKWLRALVTEKDPSLLYRQM